MILRNANSSQLDDAIIANTYTSWLKVVESYGYGNPKILFKIDGFISGIHYMMMNSLYDGFESISKDDVSDVLDYFRSNNLPLMWFVGPKGKYQNVDQFLDELEVEEATMKVPGMYIDLDVLNLDELVHYTDNLTIRQLNPGDPVELLKYTEIYIRAFSIDPAITDDMMKFSSDFQKYPDSSHYVIIEDGQPVASASVIYAAGVAGIYHVATLPEYQRRGYGSALMVILMKEAKEKGFQYSILHSSEKGKYVYERLGYQVKFWFKRYLLRPKDVNL